MKSATIHLLKNHPDAIPKCAEIWHETIGKIWAPEIQKEKITQRFHKHMNDNDLPITWLALENNHVLGMCSLRGNEGIRADLTPWLGSLVVDPKHQKNGIGKMLVDVTKEKAKELGFKKLQLFALDPSIPDYYRRLGWTKIGMDQFKGHPVTVMEITL